MSDSPDSKKKPTPSSALENTIVFSQNDLDEFVPEELVEFQPGESFAEIQPEQLESVVDKE
ncbi:MAG: hypothetical protein AABZ60_18750, partial [Planctomycetota bacterium]